MKTIVINDLHLGVTRSGGTTQSSMLALRDYGHTQHRWLLWNAEDGDTVIVNGDLADQYDIPLGQALEIYGVAADFLRAKPKCRLVWAVGNHDLSKDSSKLGTVAFLGALLEAAFLSRFDLMVKPGALDSTTWVIPHVANQDMFDMELTRIPDNVKNLLLHCNYDNEFAGQMDHSLNLSRRQAKVLKDRGITMIFGHEHQQKTSLGGAVVVVGNQFPASVSDCLNNESKRLVKILEDGSLEFVNTWSVDSEVGYYKEVDWRDVATFMHAPAGFIRVSGNATGEEAADVVKAISALRQRSEAFVVTNAVQIEQAGGLEDLAASVEDVRSVNVIDLLLETLDVDQQNAVKRLLGRKDEVTSSEKELEEEPA